MERYFVRVYAFALVIGLVYAFGLGLQAWTVYRVAVAAAIQESATP